MWKCRVHFFSHVFQVRSRLGEMSYDVACSRLSDSGEDGKVKGTRNSSSLFLNSAGPTNRLVTMSLPQWSAVYFFSNHT